MAGGIGGFNTLGFLNQLMGNSASGMSQTGYGSTPMNLFGNTNTTSNSYGNSYLDPYSAYGYGGGSSITTGQNSGSGHLASAQWHQSSQSARGATDGYTENNLFMNQTDQQQVNLFLDPQISSGRSGTNFPVGSYLGDLVSVATEGQAAATDVDNNQQIGLDQSAHAEVGGTAINNSYQVQNNTQIVNLYLDLNLQLPGMPTNPWMPNPWAPGAPTYYPQSTYNPYGTGGYGNVGGSTQTQQPTQTAPQYDPNHVASYQDFVLTTTDMEYADRSALRESIKEYARFFDDNGARKLGRAFMTLAGAVGSGENIERAERRFLRFEDAVADLTAEEKAYFHEGLLALAEEVPFILSDELFADELPFILSDLGEAVSGLTSEELSAGNVDVAA